MLTQLCVMLCDQVTSEVEAAVRGVGQTVHGSCEAIAGVVMLLIGATSVFGELQTDVDRIWDSPKPRHAGLWGMLRGRVLSFGMVLGIGFLLLVSLVLSAALAALGHFWRGWLPGWTFLPQAINFALSLPVVPGLFGMIYRFLPLGPRGGGDGHAPGRPRPCARLPVARAAP